MFISDMGVCMKRLYFYTSKVKRKTDEILENLVLYTEVIVNKNMNISLSF